MCHHPDNPTNLEVFHEEIEEAIRLAKSGQRRTETAPWVPPRLTTAVIRETMMRATELLLAELGKNMDRRDPS